MAWIEVKSSEILSYGIEFAPRNYSNTQIANSRYLKYMDLSHIDLDLERLIRRTGEFAEEEFNHFSSDRVEYKGENNPFTYVDVTAEEMLKAGCSRLIPLSGFINEESESQPSQNGFTWIIDPIDGTHNFIHGHRRRFCGRGRFLATTAGHEAERQG